MKEKINRKGENEIGENQVFKNRIKKEDGRKLPGIEEWLII